jgi:NDP-sugar pyrophosphorylase family protein
MANPTLPPVVILAGGLATRLRPITTTIPKALVDINGKPFIWYQLKLLQQAGIRSVVLCVGHLGDMIQSEVGDGSAFGLEIQYSFDGNTLLGTGGAIQKALPLLGSEFFILYGDSYLDSDYAEIYESFVQSGQHALMTVLKNDGKWDKSNTHVHENKVLIYNKNAPLPEMQYIDYGLGLMRSKLWLDHSSSLNPPFDLAEVYHDLAQHGLLAGYEVEERFYEIGSHVGLQETRLFLIAQER